MDSARSKADFTMDYSVFEYDSSKKMMIEHPGNGDFTEFFPCAKLGRTIFYHMNHRQGLNVKTAKRHHFFSGVQHEFHQHKNFSNKKNGEAVEDCRIS